MKDNQMKPKRTQAVVKLLAVMVMLGFACGSVWAQRIADLNVTSDVDRFVEGHLVSGNRGQTINGLHMGKKFIPAMHENPTSGVLYLDAYVTGSVKVTEIHLPCDIVLVLDVSGSMNEELPDYSYAPLASNSYSYNNFGNTRRYYYKYEDNYYRVYRDYSGGVYYLYFTVAGETKYLYGTGVVDQKPSGPSQNNNTIWTGVLRERSKTKLAALKMAVSDFIDIVEEDAVNNGADATHPLDHRISIVKYGSYGNVGYYNNSESSITEGNHKSNGYNYTEVVCNNRSVTNTTDNKYLKDQMAAITQGGATYAEYGMKKAQYVMANAINVNGNPNNRSRVVVMFTDGEPNHESGFDPTVAKDAVLYANPFKYKDGTPFYDATVWSVGIFSNPSEQIKTYLSHLSSNFVNSTDYNAGTQNPDSNVDPNDPSKSYSIIASNGAELSRVFKVIAQQSGGQTINLGTETIVQDVITPYFELNIPTDQDLKDVIKVYTAEMTGYSDTYQPGSGSDQSGDNPYAGGNDGTYYDENGCHFDTPVSVGFTIDEDEGDEGEKGGRDVGIVLKHTEDGTQLSISGFDFTDNWCGKDESNPTGGYVRKDGKGHKIILEIPIEAKQGVWGDSLPTNTEMSAIFDNGQIIGTFPKPHHSIEKTTWVDQVTSEPEGYDSQNINSAEDLAWYISVVTGFNGQIAAPNTSGKLTADVNMSAYNWVPIGGFDFIEKGKEANSSQGFTGNFDGGGHSIKGLKNQPSVVRQVGMFGCINGGTVENVFITDCDFHVGMEGYFGIIADTVSNGGKIVNSEAAGVLQVGATSALMRDNPQDPHKCYLGGIAGLVGRGGKGENVSNSAGVVHSCISVANLIGYSLGGVVNELANKGSAEMKNCYSYAMFHNWNEDYGTYLGGLVANNLGGKVQNCYIREREEYSNDLYVPAIDMYGIKAQYDAIDPGTKDATWHKGLLIGNNTGTALNFYVPNAWNALGTQMGVPAVITVTQDQTEINTVNIESFSDAETPYLYKHNDTRTYALGETTTPTGRLLNKLNAWVNSNDGSGTTPWFRTTAAGINDDYPVLKISDFECVASDSVVLHYGGINEMLSTRQLSKTADKTDDTICLYKNAAVTKGNNGTTLYINEDVAILQEESLDAFVGITLDNSAGSGGANSTHPDPTYPYDDDAIDWHMFATSLSDAPLGVNYNGDTQHWPFTYDTPTIGDNTMPEYRFYPETGTDAVDGYFPSHVYGTEYGAEGSDYYKYWDYYCWSEKDQHYINFKRNSNSHWKENNDGYGVSTVQINYNNEKNLVPGKGYMLATAEPTFLQSHGTLNNGVVTNTGITYTENPFCVGYNLVGNPYQSYLDFDAFATENGVNTYSILNEDEGGYETYTKGATSGNRYINMHQGFFIEVPSGKNSVVFNNGMRAITTVSGYAPSAFRGEEQVSYPWVKITMTEQSGYRDYTTIEFDRPELGGGEKMMDLRLGDAVIYANYDGVGYSTFFATSDINSIPVRFVTVADGGFTLSWEMDNAKFGSIYLVDNINGQKIDMLSHNSYKFEGRASDYSSRFKIVFELTNTEEGDEEVAEDVNFAFQMDGNLVVNGLGHFEMFDNMGRLVLATDLYDTQNTIGVAQLAQGIYVLRLADEKNVKFQKIVVR